MRKHKIENPVWKEVLWRPEKIEQVWETFSHLATLSPRSRGLGDTSAEWRGAVFSGSG